jgi:hypothetical protein
VVQFTTSTVLALAMRDLVFVLISDQKCLRGCAESSKNRKICDWHRSFVCLFVRIRINKKNSQKDAEQKKSGNYFFYDDGADDEVEEEVDDDDL